MKKYISLALLLATVLSCLFLAACLGGEEYSVTIDIPRLYDSKAHEVYRGYSTDCVVEEGTVLEEPEVPEVEGFTFIGWEWYNPHTDTRGTWSFDTPINADTIASYGFANTLHIQAVFSQDQFRYVLNEEGTGYVAAELLYLKDERFEDLGVNMGTITIPDTYRGLPVVAIGDGACEWDSFNNVGVWGQAGRVTIGKNVTSIGERAFAGRVTNGEFAGELVIPDGVTYIGAYAFEGCSFSSVTLPAGLTEIAPYTFASCGVGTEIVIPDGVTSIGAHAFDSVHIIQADKDSNYLYDIVLPDSVTEIGEYAFYDSGLSSITLPKGLATIEPFTFSMCDDLKSITIPEGVTYIGDEAFSQTGLESITLPATLRYIGKRAFFSCYELKAFPMCAGVEYIGEEAFFNSWNLEQIDLPDTLTYIGVRAFEQTQFMTDLKAGYGGDKEEYPGLYYGNYLLGHINSWGTDVPVREGTTLIASGVFEDMGLTSVTLPSTLKYIGDRAFYQCKNLASVSMPDSVLTIGDECFAWCQSLASLKLSASLTELPYYAFAGCKVGDVVIPDSVKTLGAYVFYRGGVKSVNLPEGLENIPDYAFYECYLTTIVIPESVIYIGDSAFEKCRLESITLPTTPAAVSIGKGAFASNQPLTALFIPANALIIESGAFYGCLNLTNVTFGATEGGYRMWAQGATGPSPKLTVSDLSDPATAARYLADDYAGYQWNYYKDENND